MANMQQTLVALCLLISVAAAVDIPNPYAAVATNPDFSILKTAIDTVGLKTALSEPKFQGTIFAPNDAAFGRLLTKLSLTSEQLLSDKKLVLAVLLYHVSPTRYPSSSLKNGQRIKTLLGSRLQVKTNAKRTAFAIRAASSRAQVVAANIDAPKAVIHVVSEVLIPSLGAYKNCKSVATLATNAKLTSLVTALDAAGLSWIFKSKLFAGTVFAPTNEAFDALLKKLGTTLPELAKNKQLLISVLSYHVVPLHRVYASDITNGAKARTLLLKKVTFDLQSRPGSVLVRGVGSTARVEAADFFACRAVVHVIDTVLLPIKI